MKLLMSMSRVGARVLLQIVRGFLSAIDETGRVFLHVPFATFPRAEAGHARHAEYRGAGEPLATLQAVFESSHDRPL